MASEDKAIEYLANHLPYELLMLRHCYERTLKNRDELDWNAFHEAFAVHARNLFDFLTNGGTNNNFNAADFSGFKAARGSKIDTRVRVILNQDLHRQVFHPGKQRTTEDREKVGPKDRKVVFDWVEAQLAKFIETLDEKTWKPHWHPDRADPKKIRELFRAQRQTILMPIGPQSASTAAPVAATGFDWPDRNKNE
jgi:hypothetical protein